MGGGTSRMRFSLTCLAVLGALSTAASPASAQYLSDCVSDRVDGFVGTPFPVLAGMTRAGVVGAGVGILAHSSLFDSNLPGEIDLFSAPVNTLVGAVDCGQLPDMHFAWGYSFKDSTVNEDDFLRITVTAFARDVGSSSAACDFFDQPTMVVHDLNTGPPNASLWEEASTLIWGLDGLNCVAGRFFQIRVRAVGEEDFQPDITADGCFMVSQAGNCPGAGAVCN